jgi:hypothetical protein
MRRLLFFVALDFLTTVVAGHGYDVGGSGRESDGENEIAGLTMTWILAAGGIALVTAGVLLWTNPEAQARLKRVRWKTAAPKAVIVIIIAAPLVAWTASSASGDDPVKLLMAERGTALTGEPELLISLGEDDLNATKTARGKKTVRLVCVDRRGKVVIDAQKKWPFVYEQGYDYPHRHQLADRELVQRAQKCSVKGTTVLLEAKVEGALPRR